jgi:hypothetical protein
LIGLGHDVANVIISVLTVVIKPVTGEANINNI